jgi:hypothetical protein
MRGGFEYPLSSNESDLEQGVHDMDLYVIRRRGAWANDKELEAASELSTRVGQDMADRLQWIRSYAVQESDGRVGSVCIYQGRNDEAIREHGRRINAPSEDFQIVKGTAIVKDDPPPVARV